MKIFVVFLLSLTCFDRAALAQSPSYLNVPTAEERAEDPFYVRFPNWQTIDVVQEGVLNPEYLSVLQTTPEDTQRAIRNLETLQIREFDLDPGSLTLSAQPREQVLIPFVVGIRFQRKGIFGSLVQGTMNARGVIRITVNSRGLIHVDVESYDDSQILELVGRSIGLLNNYDGNFAAIVIAQYLGTFLLQEENSTILTDIASYALEDAVLDPSQFELCTQADCILIQP